MTGASVSRGILVWRSVSRLRGRYTILFVLVAVSTAFSIIGISLGSYAGERSSGSAQETARMREITIYPDRAHITESGLSVVRGISADTEANPFVRVVGGMTDSAVSVSMVGVDPRSLPPNLVDGSFGPAGDDEWIVLPSRAAGAELSDLLDTVVTITVTTAVDFESGTTRDIPLRVSGIADPSYQVDAVDAAYVSLDRAKTLYFDRLGIAPGELDAVGGYEKATVIVADQRDVGRVVEELQGHGYQAISALQEMQAVPGVIALVRLVSSALIRRRTGRGVERECLLSREDVEYDVHIRLLRRSLRK